MAQPRIPVFVLLLSGCPLVFLSGFAPSLSFVGGHLASPTVAETYTATFG